MLFDVNIITSVHKKVNRMLVEQFLIEKANTFRLKFESQGGVGMTIGFIIKTIRETHGLSQTDFANLCYRTKDWVYLIETNSPKTKITKEDLVLLAEELKEPILKTLAVGMNYEGLAKCMRLESE